MLWTSPFPSPTLSHPRQVFQLFRGFWSQRHTLQPLYMSAEPPLPHSQIPLDASNSADPTRPQQQIIKCLTVSPSEETLVASTDQAQLYYLTLSSADIGKVGWSSLVCCHQVYWSDFVCFIDDFFLMIFFLWMESCIFLFLVWANALLVIITVSWVIFKHNTWDGVCWQVYIYIGKYVWEMNIFWTICLQGDQATFEVLAQAFHNGQILGLDVCIRKPLIATCSLDRSVRIWNNETW